MEIKTLVTSTLLVLISSHCFALNRHMASMPAVASGGQHAFFESTATAEVTLRRNEQSILKMIMAGAVPANSVGETTSWVNECESKSLSASDVYLVGNDAGQQKKHSPAVSEGPLSRALSIITAEENAFRKACVLIADDKDEEARGIINHLIAFENSQMRAGISGEQFTAIRQYFLHYGILTNDTCSEYAVDLVQIVNNVRDKLY